jgi:hypothetical protein
MYLGPYINIVGEGLPPVLSGEYPNRKDSNTSTTAATTIASSID